MGNATKRRPIFGRMYPAMAQAMDEGGMAERRRELLAGLTGEVVEVGAGHGVNFPHYPVEVARLVAVEPEPRLREQAQAAAAGAAVTVEVVPGPAYRLPLAEHSVDAVVFCLHPEGLRCRGGGLQRHRGEAVARHRRAG